MNLIIQLADVLYSLKDRGIRLAILCHGPCLFKESRTLPCCLFNLFDLLFGDARGVHNSGLAARCNRSLTLGDGGPSCALRDHAIGE